MSMLSERLNKYSSEPIFTLTKLLAEKPDGLVTVCGFEFREGKLGRGGVFKIKELGGAKFWATGKMLKEELIPMLMTEYETEAAINAAFAAEPQMMKIGQLVTTKNGNRFRPIEFLGDAEK